VSPFFTVTSRDGAAKYGEATIAKQHKKIVSEQDVSTFKIKRKCTELHDALYSQLTFNCTTLPKPLPMPLLAWHK